jgi:hypothetical protein
MSDSSDADTFVCEGELDHEPRDVVSDSSSASDFAYTGTPSDEYYAMRAAYEACATPCYFGEFRSYLATRTYALNGLTYRGSEEEEQAARDGDIAKFIDATRRRQARPPQYHDTPSGPMKTASAPTRARDQAGSVPGYAAQPAGQRATLSVGQDLGSASALSPGPLTLQAETDAPTDASRPSRSQRRNANRRHRARNATEEGGDAAN